MTRECPECLRRTDHDEHKSGFVRFHICSWCGFATPVESEAK